jgi:hypothetical protein
LFPPSAPHAAVESASTAIIIIATIFFFIRISPFLFCL